MRVSAEEVLEFLWGCFETFSRHDMGWVLAGYRLTESEQRASRMARQLERRGLIIAQGNDRQPRYVLSDAGRRRIMSVDARAAWDTPWDGKWRVVAYDLPEVQRKERFNLWSALRAQNFGLLQRSVWVWPLPVETILLEIIKAQGLPECFCGFQADQVFLCSTVEVVASAWDWEEITHRHNTYLKHLVATPAALRKAQDLPAILPIARVEREAYRYAFARDPLLPRELCPPRYTGFRVAERHKQFRAALARRMHELAPR